MSERSQKCDDCQPSSSSWFQQDEPARDNRPSTDSSGMKLIKLLAGGTSEGTNSISTSSATSEPSAWQLNVEANKASETVVSPRVDPAVWPSHILYTEHLEIVNRSPFVVASKVYFPKAPDGRAFHSSLLYRGSQEVGLCAYSGKMHCFVLLLSSLG